MLMVSWSERRSARKCDTHGLRLVDEPIKPSRRSHNVITLQWRRFGEGSSSPLELEKSLLHPFFHKWAKLILTKQSLYHFVCHCRAEFHTNLLLNRCGKGWVSNSLMESLMEAIYHKPLMPYHHVVSLCLSVILHSIFGVNTAGVVAGLK
jgi:hypothetical protein